MIGILRVVHFTTHTNVHDKHLKAVDCNSEYWGSNQFFFCPKLSMKL